MSEPIMKIKAGTIEVPIKTNIGRNEPIDNVRREIIDVITTEPLTIEQINALKTNDWEMYWDNTLQGTQVGYTDVVEYHTWFAQPIGDAEMVQTLTQEKTQLINEKANLVQEKEALVEEKETLVVEKTALATSVNTMRTAARTFLDNRQDDVLIQLLDLMEEWQLYIDEEQNTYASYSVGNSRKHLGHPYACIQGHSTDGDINRAPDKAAALWAVYHAKSAQYALPWIAPTHAEDIYRVGEFMVYTDDIIYECLVSTDRSPEVLPDNWRAVDAEGNPIEPAVNPEEPTPEEPEEPVERNSNGTAVWSEWRAWTSGLNSDLYQIDDRVTQNELRYIATIGNNHYEPASGVGWQLA